MDRRIPTEPPTYSESCEATYELMKRAAQDEAASLERLSVALDQARSVGLVPLPREHRDHGTRYFHAVRDPAPQQVDAVRAVRAADAAYQKAHAERKHWEGYWRRYADMIKAEPKLADEPLRRTGWVRKVAGRRAA